MARWFRFLFRFGLALILLVSGYLVGLIKSGPNNRSQVLAWVNGSPITRTMLDRELAQFERRSVELLCYRTLVVEQAKAKGCATGAVDISDDSKVDSLLDKLCIYGLDPGYFRKIYDNFSQELEVRDLVVAVVSTESLSNSFSAEVKGGGSFEDLCTKFGRPLDGQADFNLAGQSNELLHDRFGGDTAERLLALKVGGTLGPIPWGGASIFVKVSRLKASYEDLLPSIEKMVARSRRLLVLNSITSRAWITATAPFDVARLYRPADPSEELPAEDGRSVGNASRAEKPAPKFSGDRQPVPSGLKPPTTTSLDHQRPAGALQQQPVTDLHIPQADISPRSGDSPLNGLPGLTPPSNTATPVGGR